MATVSVFCILRDSEKHLARFLSQLEDIEGLVGFDFSFFFYENDSVDNTASILSKWLKGRRGKLLSEKIGSKKYGSVKDPARMKLLCSCRNKCKILAEENETDYSLLVDSDINFTSDNFLQHVRSLERAKDAVMMTANCRQNIPDLTFGETKDSYYDVYAFRDRHGNSGLYFADCPSYNREDQLRWKIGLPIQSMSSFGGFALLRSWAFNLVSWSAEINCDHVNMCFDLNALGKIYCDPSNKVYVSIDLTKINIEACKHNGEEQQNFHNEHY